MPTAIAPTSIEPGPTWTTRTIGEVVPSGPATLATVAKATGTTAQEIARRNGVRWSVREINRWVIRTGGKWLPRKPGAPAVPGSPTGGWAVFDKAKSRIKLPQRDERGTLAKLNDSGYLWWAVGGLSLLLLASVANRKRRARRSTSKKKKRGKRRRKRS